MDTIRKADSRRGRIAYEVAGLAWLAEASDPGAPVVPVLGHGATWLEEPRLVSVSPTPRAAEEFGRALAHTHAAGASHLGAPPPGFEGAGWMGEAHLSLPGQPSPAPACGNVADGSWASLAGGVPCLSWTLLMGLLVPVAVPRLWRGRRVSLGWKGGTVYRMVHPDRFTLDSEKVAVVRNLYPLSLVRALRELRATVGQLGFCC